MFLDIMIILLVIVSFISGLVALLGKSRWERLVGYSLVSAKINMLIIIYALMTENTFYLDMALVYIILSYIGMIVLASYMIRMGVKKKGD